ncbi:Na+/H+ antiporter NhaC family protein, partial [Fusobacterium sp. SYSU M8D902]|uniref:Na+/H+ antiporter NhaC family protein n=1 Tax=Fusobacterium sp. SYSU M8D902 TaxID=3159562 RepID=UPI0032E3FDC1
MVEFIKLMPVFILAALMMSGFDALLAAPLATVAAAIVAMVTEKRNFSEVVDAALANVREITVALFILMLAYAMAEVFMATGVGAAIINVALRLGITGKTVALVGVVVTSILSIATGSSWGTFAACAPIFLWLN